MDADTCGIEGAVESAVEDAVEGAVESAVESACVIDSARPCRSCSAPSPRSCPYIYLLADDPPADGGADGDGPPARSDTESQ